MLNRNFIQTEEEIYFRYNLSDTEIIFRDQNIYRFKAIDLSALKPPIELQLNKEANKFVPVSKVQAPIKLSPAYLCPLSHQIMLDPVMAGDGYTYEREEIQKALALKPISPLTNEALEDTRLIPNHAIRSAIAELLTQHSELWDENNAHGETVYFSTGLQQQAITALHNGTSDSLKRYLERDPRLLVRSTATTVNFLELACQQGSFETLKVVLNAMKQAAWEKILKQTNAEILLQLCSRHLGIEAAQLLGNHLGWTVKEYQEQAYKAIAQGDKQLLSACLMAGISVNMLDAKKWSLLHYAAKDGQIPIVIYLIQAGADAKLKNDEGLKAAQVARVFKHETTAQAIEAEQFKAKLKLLNLHSGSVDTSISLLPQINQLQEQVDHLVKTVQQLQAEVVFLKEQLKVTSTHNIPLLGSQLPTFSSTPEINNDNYPKKFFGNN